MNQETKNKISKAKKGTIPWNKNKKGLQVAWNKGKVGYMKGKSNGMYKDGLSWGNYLGRKEKTAGRKRPETCDICGSIGVMDFDHDHNSGKFRGWICRRCNLVLGMVKDNFELLQSLSDYLKNALPRNNSHPKDNAVDEKDKDNPRWHWRLKNGVDNPDSDSNGAE